MTVKDFIYDTYFPFPSSIKESVFRLSQWQTDISKNYITLYYGARSQPTDVYNKIVVKFWIHEICEDKVVFWIVYK